MPLKRAASVVGALVVVAVLASTLESSFVPREGQASCLHACASTCTQPPASARSTRAAKNERSSKPQVYQRMSGCERSVGTDCRHGEASSISGDGVRRVGSSVSGRSRPAASRARSTLSIA